MHGQHLESKRGKDDLHGETMHTCLNGSPCRTPLCTLGPDSIEDLAGCIYQISMRPRGRSSTKGSRSLSIIRGIRVFQVSETGRYTSKTIIENIMLTTRRRVIDQVCLGTNSSIDNNGIGRWGLIEYIIFSDLIVEDRLCLSRMCLGTSIPLLTKFGASSCTQCHRGWDRRSSSPRRHGFISGGPQN